MSSSSLLAGSVDVLFGRGLQTKTRTLESSGPVRAVDEANASGCSLTLVDSTGAGSDQQIWTITGSGGPPITTAIVTAAVPIQHIPTQAGRGTLVAGTLTIANTAVTANSVILVTNMTDATTPLGVTTINAGVSFVVSDGGVGSNDVFSYFIARY